MTTRELAIELASGLRQHVLPYLGSHAGRAHLPAGAGGDVTFAIDQEAEAYLERFLAEKAPDVAFYSEDRGLVLPPGVSAPSELPEVPADAPSKLPEFPAKEIPVLVVDPIDGTRPAMAGFESCCVSVAAAPLEIVEDGGRRGPTMADVHTGCIVEIKTGAAFVAERGRGIEITNPDGSSGRPALSATTDLTKLFWTLGFRGRPALPIVQVLEELIDASSVGGGVFDLGSATYDLTRIVTGQLDAYLDVGPRIIDEVPALRERFEVVGGGAVLNNSPYDLAAAVLCLEEAGATVTDARGASLAPRPLLGSGHEYQMSCLATANERLQELVLDSLERGFKRLARRP
jgi:myo-inositol-1(or 4)-monophosphatase